jgi:hypothetical protein
MVKKIAKHETSRRQGSHSKAFKEGLSTLIDEIQLAFLWQRPSILLAVNNSKAGQIKAQQALKRELKKININVKQIKVEEKKTDVINTMIKILDRDKIVFFVSGSGSVENKDSSDFHNALNFHRELLVDYKIRLVLWLTESEAENLPRYAPDFWAFRHRVIEFAVQRGTKKKALYALLNSQEHAIFS